MRASIVRAGSAGRAAAPLEVAIAAFAVSALLTTAATIAEPAISPISPLPILVALAAFCVAALLRSSAPSLAWIATIGGSYVAASVPIARARAADPGLLGIGSWLGFAVPVSVAAIVTLAIAAAYATQPQRRLGRAAVAVSALLLGWLVVACVTTLGLIGSGLARPDPEFTWLDVATVPITAFVPFVAAVTALGIAGDVRAAAERARERIGPASGASALERTSDRLWALAVATARELLPGQSAAREATVAAERTRLAGDLHASVLPGLRRAIAEAEAGGDPETLARQLRAVDLELERLMADRWPVVLEAFGLIAALEDVAERLETDTGLSVAIDVERAGDRPPPAVERVVWRVAQIALDNAVRHAAASTITCSISVTPERVTLGVADDGRGFDPASPGAARPGSRGLADARRRVEEIGGTVRIEETPGGGSTVRVEWAARSARPA